MADVVGQPGHVDEVGITAQPDRHTAADLGHLQRVGQPGARRLALARPDHLRLVGQPAQGRAVQHPRPVTGEIGAVLGVGTGQRGTLRRFDHQSLPVELVVGVGIHRHRRTVCQYYIDHACVIARLLSLVLAVLAAGLCWPRPPPPNRRFGVQTHVTDNAGVLSA